MATLSQPSGPGFIMTIAIEGKTPNAHSRLDLAMSHFVVA
ncbi:MAG: hypothetical protein QOI01_489 [Mycobacterium sp.]|jgi:hypothetical protein|nr:hypothetical protein [Mycobacterium sp.]